MIMWLGNSDALDNLPIVIAATLSEAISSPVTEIKAPAYRQLSGTATDTR